MPVTRTATMKQFVHWMNLDRLRRLLPESKDEAQHRQIEKLIAEEEAKGPPLEE